MNTRQLEQELLQAERTSYGDGVDPWVEQLRADLARHMALLGLPYPDPTDEDLQRAIERSSDGDSA